MVIYASTQGLIYYKMKYLTRLKKCLKLVRISTCYPIRTLHMSASSFKLLENLFVRSWWVILFALLCFVLFEQGIKKRDQDFTKLSQHYSELKIAKENALKIQAVLLQHMNSESDPAWIELVLMQELGLTPEEHTKVFFTSS